MHMRTYIGTACNGSLESEFASGLFVTWIVCVPVRLSVVELSVAIVLRAGLQPVVGVPGRAACPA